MDNSLSDHETSLILGVFRAHPGVSEVRLFGSRALGRHSPNSDIDLAILGEIDPLETQRIASELDDLPLPYRFDVVTMNSIELQPLRDHILRFGIRLYPDGPDALSA